MNLITMLGRIRYPSVLLVDAFPSTIFENYFVKGYFLRAVFKKEQTFTMNSFFFSLSSTGPLK